MPLPPGCVHVNVPKAQQICRKLNIEHVPAVIGFEKNPGGRTHPCVSGVVTFVEFEPIIKAEHKKNKKLEKERKLIKLNQNAKKAWRQLIKAILVKKYISTTYDHIA